jgi:HK97 gp10 family phage protein
VKTFKTFGGAANYLRRLALESHEVTAHIAELAGVLVEARAKGIIGHYQPRLDQWTAWAQLKPSTEEHKARMGYPANAPLEASGAMRDSIKHAVQAGFLGATVVVGTDDMKMVYHEFGTEKMPPRPVLGPAMYGSLKDIEHIAGLTVSTFLAGGAWKRPIKAE